MTSVSWTRPASGSFASGSVLGSDSASDSGVSAAGASVSAGAADSAGAAVPVGAGVAAVLALSSGFRELHALGGQLAADALGLVFSLASEEPDDDLRSTCIWALGELCRADLAAELEMDPAAIEQVIALLERSQDDAHEWCARYATEALAKVRG